MHKGVIAIVGATASGKSDVALRLAEEIGGEIISCDSIQVYRDFVIGCAKPSSSELARVRHHLIDVVNWDEAFDVQQYRQLARAAIADIEQRGKQPILCGGTGLYLRALRYGLIETPPASAQLREAWLAEEREQPGILYQKLSEVDPETARRTEPRNWVHVLRALEIHATTGQLPSRLKAEHNFATEQVPMQAFLLTHDATPLRQRIDQRALAMLRKGLVDEVKTLLSKGVTRDCRPMASVGYREVCDVLIGGVSEDGLAERIAQSTWHYARRQRTWFRREKSLVPLEMTTVEEVVSRILNQVDAAP